jgi:hypothetical protein
MPRLVRLSEISFDELAKLSCANHETHAMTGGPWTTGVGSDSGIGQLVMFDE